MESSVARWFVWINMDKQRSANIALLCTNPSPRGLVIVDIVSITLIICFFLLLYYLFAIVQLELNLQARECTRHVNVVLQIYKQIIYKSPHLQNCVWIYILFICHEHNDHVYLSMIISARLSSLKIWFPIIFFYFSNTQKYHYLGGCSSIWSSAQMKFCLNCKLSLQNLTIFTDFVFLYLYSKVMQNHVMSLKK